MRVAGDSEDAPRESFLDRFVHPRLAAIAIGGATLWGVSFLVAASGVAFRASGRFILGAQLFFLSSLIGVVGIFVLGLCALWLGGVWVRRTVFRSEND